MAKKKGVSSKTHTQKQLNDYANQNNPNNKAYKAKIANAEKQKEKRKHVIEDDCFSAPCEWMYYGNPFDFD